MTEVWCLKWNRELTQGEEEALWAALPARRRQRLETSAGERTQVLCAYGLLRLALGGKALPAIALGERGKPYFPDHPELYFSLSHTDGAALVGVSDRPVGVDIEKIRPLGRRVKERLGAELTEEEAFCRWTALEARAKRSGRGVGEFLHGKMEPSTECISLAVGGGYCASAACEGDFILHRCSLEDLFF